MGRDIELLERAENVDFEVFVQFVDKFGDCSQIGDVVFVVGKYEANEVEDKAFVLVLQTLRSTEVFT